MMTRAWFAGVAMIPLACGPATEVVLTPSVEAVSGDTDPNPVITFTQVATLVGINRSNEPASAGSFSASGTLAYGGWLVDLDGDGRLDYFGVNHGQWPHLSGLFINNGAGGFGKNLFPRTTTSKISVSVDGISTHDEHVVRGYVTAQNNRITVLGTLPDENTLPGRAAVR